MRWTATALTASAPLELHIDRVLWTPADLRLPGLPWHSAQTAGDCRHRLWRDCWRLPLQTAERLLETADTDCTQTAGDCRHKLRRLPETAIIDWVSKHLSKLLPKARSIAGNTDPVTISRSVPDCSVSIHLLWISDPVRPCFLAITSSN